MNTGIFGEGFPYSNFHDLNMDWIIKIAKDFLDQYTHIQEIIEQGKEDIQTLTESGITQIGDLTATSLQELDDKATTLETALQEWYNTHSDDIANQLTLALADLDTWYTQHQGYLDSYLQSSINSFNTAADTKAAEVIASIPSDYTTLANNVYNILTSLHYILGMSTISFTNDKIIYTNGEVGSQMSTWPVTNTDYRYADLPITPNQLIILNVTGGDGPRAWCFGDAEGKLISNAQANTIASNLILIPPANATRLVINDAKTNLTSYIGKNVPQQIEDAQYTIMSYILSQQDEYPVTHLTTNRFYYNADVRVETPSYPTSRTYDVTNVKSVIIRFSPTHYYNEYTFTDEADNIISYKQATETIQDTIEIGVSVPSGATKLYVSTTTNFNNMSVKGSGGTYLYDKIIERTELHPLVLPKNTFLGWFNADAINTAYGYSALYRVYDIESVTIKLIPRGRYVNTYTFTDENNEVISYLQTGAEFDSEQTYEVEVPSNATKLFVTDVNMNTSEAGSTITVYGNNPLTLQNFRGYTNQHINKKIVWYGTSIPAAGYIARGSTNGYPQRVGRLLGAEVINESVGSSCIHCKDPARISSLNPYGFIGNFTFASRCLSNTIEEMQWIIDNWNSTIWTSGTLPSAPTADQQQEILSFSYENRIGQYLNANDEPDIWVFDHGKNDADFNGTYNPNDPYSLYSTRGAFNFLIKYILTYNPHSRILIIGHYENQLYPSVAQIQQAVADDWLIPIMKLWEYLQWSQKVINTKGDWVNGYWIPDAVPAGHDMTMLNIALPDNLHPHADLSGNTLEFIARHISKWILNYYENPLN